MREIVVKKFILGVDPGRTGGFALLDASGSLQYKKALDFMGSLDLAREVQFIATNFPNTTVYKEEFHSYGVDGKRSYDVGYQHGCLDRIIEVEGLKMIRVRAYDWQKIYRTKDNEKLKPKVFLYEAVLKLYPDLDLRATNRHRVAHAGIIDALLLAEYGRRKELEKSD